MIGRCGTIREIVTAPERITDGGDRENAGDDVPPAHMIAEARGQRKQQEAQDERERNVRVAQLLRRDDGVSRIEVEQRHRHGDDRHRLTGETAQPVGCSLIGFDELFSFLEGFVRNSRRSISGRCRSPSSCRSSKPLFEYIGACGLSAQAGPFVRRAFMRVCSHKARLHSDEMKESTPCDGLAAMRSGSRWSTAQFAERTLMRSRVSVARALQPGLKSCSRLEI